MSRGENESEFLPQPHRQVLREIDELERETQKHEDEYVSNMSALAHESEEVFQRFKIIQVISAVFGTAMIIISQPQNLTVLCPFRLAGRDEQRSKRRVSHQRPTQ